MCVLFTVCSHTTPHVHTHTHTHTHTVYCTCLLTRHVLRGDLDVDCNPMFYVNVNDIDTLQNTRHYVACESSIYCSKYTQDNPSLHLSCCPPLCLLRLLIPPPPQSPFLSPSLFPCLSLPLPSSCRYLRTHPAVKDRVVRCICGSAAADDPPGLSGPHPQTDTCRQGQIRLTQQYQVTVT